MKKIKPGYYQLKPDKKGKPTLYGYKKENPVLKIIKQFFKILVKILQISIAIILIIVIIYLSRYINDIVKKLIR